MLASMSYIADTTEKTGLAFRLGKVVDMYYRTLPMEVKVFFFCREEPTYLLSLWLLARWAELACTRNNGRVKGEAM